MVLLGDFKNVTALQLVESSLGSWPVASGQQQEPAAVPADAPPSNAPGNVVYLVDQPGLKQAVVMMAEPGIRQTDDDVHALDVVASVMNGVGGTAATAHDTLCSSLCLAEGALAGNSVAIRI
jgi:predicted Zn-dependent peptidase